MNRYDELLTAAGYTRYTSEATARIFGSVCYTKDGADDINYCLTTGLWADEHDACGNTAASLADYLKPKPPKEQATVVVFYERTAGFDKGKRRETEPMSPRGVFEFIMAAQPLKIYAVRAAD